MKPIFIKIMLIFGLTGLAGCGKGEVANYLKSYGFQRFVFSNILKKEAKKRGLVSNDLEKQKEFLSKLGDRLRKESGKMEILAIMIIEQIKVRKLDKVVVDGFRSVEEVNIFRKTFPGFKLIFIDTPEEIRFQRRKLDDPKANLKSFRERDERDIKEKGLGEVIKIADIKIDNSGTRKELYNKLEKIF